MAAEYNLKNVVFFPFQPRQEVPCIYALADVSLVSLKKDIVVESVPSKTYTIMASGRPIVATVDPATEVGHLLSQAQCGICVEPDNPSALIDAILTLYRDATLRRIMGINARDFVVAHYSRQVAAHQYYDTIQHFDRDGHT
jgi:colanic acid biosynthesis glycosyl transferase WcaI